MARKIAGQDPRIIHVGFGVFFYEKFWIFVFVRARVLCGTRKHQSASVDCSGVIQKIHMRKIRRVQGFVHDEDFLIFHGLGTFAEAKWTFQGPGVRADAQ